MANNPLTFPAVAASKGGPGFTRPGNTQPEPRIVRASAHPGVWPGDKRRPPDRPPARPMTAEEILGLPPSGEGGAYSPPSIPEEKGS